MPLWTPDLEHFAEFCRRVIRLDNGEPLILERFQRDLLADYFGGCKETLVLIPKKNGKTTLLAALVLHHLCYVDDAECYIAAASKDQAALLYRFAVRMIGRSPALQARVIAKKGTKEIRSRRDEGFVRVLAADADTADGVGPTLAIVDELHRQKSSDLYGVFSDGLDARDGAMLTISTAGDDEDSPLGHMRAKAYAHVRRRRGRYTYCRTPDGAFALHEWALRAEDNLDDLKLVKSVNPLRQMTTGMLKRRRDSPSSTRHRWARFACNVWAQDEDSAISALDWGPCAIDWQGLPDGTADVVIGIDLGWKRDTTALVPVGIRDDEELEVDTTAFYDDDDDELELPDRVKAATIEVPKIIKPPGDGTMTPEEVVKDALRELAERFPQARYVLDPNADGQTLAQWIERELCDGDDLRVLEHSQQPAPMCSASMGLSAQIRARAIRQPDDRLGLSAHVLAAAPKYHGERWRLEKNPRKKKPVDAAIALAMALRTLRAPAPEPLVPFVLRA